METAKALADVWRELGWEDIFPIHPPTLIAGLANHRDHLVPNGPLKRLLDRHLQVQQLEEAAVPLHVVAFDVVTGEEVRLSAGSAHDAVLAAASIPGVLPPVPWGERRLVDGGVVNNTPISHAIDLGAERVYVLPTQDPTSRGWPVASRGTLDAAMHAFTLLANSRLAADLARFSAEAELIVLPAANPFHVRATDFDQAQRLIEAALRAARSALASRVALESAA